MTHSRDIALLPRSSALLIIDVQNHTAHPEGGEFTGPNAPAGPERDYYMGRLDLLVLPNIARLQAACRRSRTEIIYSVIENQTADGRDRSLDYKISGIGVEKGSWDARVPDRIAPEGDEMIIPKTSSSVFISTNIDYVLRNLQTRQLAICGVVSDQCVELAVRDACDLGYLVTLVPDACATFSAERQAASERAIAGYCRKIDTEALLGELRMQEG